MNESRVFCGTQQPTPRFSRSCVASSHNSKTQRRIASLTQRENSVKPSACSSKIIKVDTCLHPRGTTLPPTRMHAALKKNRLVSVLCLLVPTSSYSLVKSRTTLPPCTSTTRLLRQLTDLFTTASTTDTGKQRQTVHQLAAHVPTQF